MPSLHLSVVRITTHQNDLYHWWYIHQSTRCEMSVNFVSLPHDVVSKIANLCDHQTSVSLMSTCRQVYEDAKVKFTGPIQVVRLPVDPQVQMFFEQMGGRVDIFPKPGVTSKDLVKTRVDYMNLRLSNGKCSTLSIVFGEPIMVHEADHSEKWMQFRIHVTGNLNMYTNSDHTHMIPWEDFINERYFIYMSHYQVPQILYGYRGQIHATGVASNKRSLIEDGTCVYHHPTWTPVQLKYSFDQVIVSDLYGNSKRFVFAHTGLIIE